MKCPRCSDTDLSHLTSLFLDECESCGGTWYDHDELRRSKDAEDAKLGWQDFEFWRQENDLVPKIRQTPCPRCAGALVALEYASTGVEVDVCPSCRGFWLDRGEFDAIIDALHDEASGMSVTEYVRAALLEAGEIVTGPESRSSEWSDLKHVMELLGLRLFVEKPTLVKALMTIQANNPLK